MTAYEWHEFFMKWFWLGAFFSVVSFILMVIEMLSSGWDSFDNFALYVKVTGLLLGVTLICLIGVSLTPKPTTQISQYSYGV